MSAQTTPSSTSNPSSDLFKASPSDFTLISGEGHRFPSTGSFSPPPFQSFEIPSRFLRNLNLPPRPSSRSTSLPRSSTRSFASFIEDRSLRDSSSRLFELYSNVLDKYDVEILYPAVAGAIYAFASKQPMEVWALLTIHDQERLAKECFRCMDQAPPAGSTRTLSDFAPSNANRWLPSNIPVDLLPLIPGAKLQQLLVAYEMMVRGGFFGN